MVNQYENLDFDGGRLSIVLRKTELEILFYRRNRTSFWGEQRLTKDVDITLFAEFGNEEVYVELNGEPEFLAKLENLIKDIK